MRFDELQLSDDILDALDAMHFQNCTPIQEQTIDIILQGHDIIACAQTGTGKTAAYLLPVIDLLAETQPDSKVKCVIMVPTHELAQQIDRRMEGFAYYIPVSSLAIHGGNDGKEFSRQQHALRQGADMIIATPGRLLAHIKMGYVDLSDVKYFILDEADRMLDMGFADDIMKIVKLLPEKRQTLMFSATMPKKIQQLAATILNNPKEIKIAVSKPADKIQQNVCFCYEPQKLKILQHILQQEPNKRIIVFSSSKQKVKEITSTLRQAKYKVQQMHSDLDQNARQQVMHQFRAGQTQILIATDIIARGIDIDDIAIVINYDTPREPEDYVHRIGRTARAGAQGKAITLVCPKDMQLWAKIQKFIQKQIPVFQTPPHIGQTPQFNPAKTNKNTKSHTKKSQHPKKQHTTNKQKNTSGKP